MHHNVIELTSRKVFIMDATDYWPFAHEYSIWKATVAALWFWTEDLDPQMLSNAIKRVYTALPSIYDMLRKKYYSVALSPH